MKFSIITICHNEEKRIQKTLENIYQQTFQDYEHIIEDGMSTDNTLSVINQCKQYYEKEQLKIYRQLDNGLYDAMNKALEHTKGDYICFLNCGDYLFDKYTLEKVNQEIEHTGFKDFYHGISIVVFPNMDEHSQRNTNLNSENKQEMNSLLSKGDPGLIHQAIYVRKKCFENNLFDTSYKLRAELKWYFSCCRRGYTIQKMNFPVCRYSFGGLSEKLISLKVSYEETRRILKEFGYSTENYDLEGRYSYSEYAKNSYIFGRWLALLQAGHSIKEYFDKHRIKTIAIYGYSEFGCHLINEIHHTDVRISYLIDRRALYPYEGIPVVRPEDKLQDVDAVVVTAIISYEEIKNYLCQKMMCPIISLEDMLEEIWYLED